LTGGPAIPVTQTDAASRGAVWLPDDTIVFATANPATGLLRVAASGGEAAVLTTPDPKQGESDHLNPESLPDGRTILFTIVSNTGAPPRIALLDLATGDRKVLVTGGSQPRYVGSGHLLYTADGVLQAVPFDLATRTTRGASAPVLRDFAWLGGGTIAMLDVAANGTLIYVRGSVTSRLPVWVDRNGKEERIKGPNTQHQYLAPRLSPDGRRLAYHDITGSGEYDVWILDLERGTTEQLTTDPGRDSEPIWSADGTHIAYFSTGRPGGPGIFMRRADGAGNAERLTEGVICQRTGRQTGNGWRMPISAIVASRSRPRPGC
jgi:dipeptidyl aminopeptidase/acylaminoacyl peptidase